MATLHISKKLPRRRFLQGMGVALKLPILECMAPLLSRGTVAKPPMRMLVVVNNLGVLPKSFFPSSVGRDYELSPYLSTLTSHREDFTVFSGLSHPGVTGGHSADNCFHGCFGGERDNANVVDDLSESALAEVCGRGRDAETRETPGNPMCCLHISFVRSGVRLATRSIT